MQENNILVALGKDITPNLHKTVISVDGPPRGIATG
jgi:hypothetical protein